MSPAESANVSHGTGNGRSLRILGFHPLLAMLRQQTAPPFCASRAAGPKRRSRQSVNRRKLKKKTGEIDFFSNCMEFPRESGEDACVHHNWIIQPSKPEIHSSGTDDASPRLKVYARANFVRTTLSCRHQAQSFCPDANFGTRNHNFATKDEHRMGGCRIGYSTCMEEQWAVARQECIGTPCLVRPGPPANLSLRCDGT